VLRLLAENRSDDVVSAALTSARRLWGQESLEPDFALLQNERVYLEEEVQESLRRACEHGDARRIFEILPKCRSDVQEPLATSLLNRAALPIAEAQAAIGSTDERTVQVAARVLGRAGAQAVKSGPVLANALQQWRKVWEERRQKMIQTNEEDDRLISRITPCLQSLLWAAGRWGVAQDALLSAATTRTDDAYYRPIRLEAVSALVSRSITKPMLAALEAIATGNDPEIRVLAAEAIGRHNAQRAAQLAERLLSDRTSFNRLTTQKDVNVVGTLRSAAGQVHYQGVALPHLIARGDTETLNAVVENRKLPEATRLGAIEGLGKLANEVAEAKLRLIGGSQGEEEEIRKAAWRALRRSKRARQRAQAAASAV
jgi:ParB family chromosome partitioning protein